MSDIRDLLRNAVGRPGRQPDVADLAVAAQQRAQRQRVGVRVAAIAVTLVVVATGAAVAFNDGGGGRVEIAAASTVSSPDASVSVELPEGWEQLPIVNRLQPVEVLVVGTAARPQGEPIEACGTGDRQPIAPSAFVTIYEYGTTDELKALSGGMYPTSYFRPKPADFQDYQGSAGSCPSLVPQVPVPAPEPSTSTSTSSAVPDPAASTTLPPTTLVSPTVTITLPVFENHFFEMGFLDDGGRRFIARVVSVGDPTRELMNQGFDILNSMVIGAPETTTTTTYNGPPDQDAAKQQIVDAINAANGTPSPVPTALSIEGGHPFADPADAEAAAEQAQNSDPLTRRSYAAAQEGKLVGRINWIVFDSPIYARMNFDLLMDDELATANTTGYAVFEDGNWRLGRGTFCEIAARGGVNCPA